MKRPVAPESTKAFTDLTSPVSVVSIPTFNIRDCEGESAGSWRAAMMSFAGRRLSQRGLYFFNGGISKVCTTWGFSSDSSIPVTLYTGKAENRLLLGDEGVHFTRRPFENPARQWN
jgi:hypothetical protein